MKPVLTVLLLLLICCGRETTLSIEEMRFRVESNRCRAVLENTYLEVSSWEFQNDETIVTDEVLREAVADSLLICPVTLDRYILTVDGTRRTLTCPAGHGSISLPQF